MSGTHGVGHLHTLASFSQESRHGEGIFPFVQSGKIGIAQKVHAIHLRFLMVFKYEMIMTICCLLGYPSARLRVNCRQSVNAKEVREPNMEATCRSPSTKSGAGKKMAAAAAFGCQSRRVLTWISSEGMSSSPSQLHFLVFSDCQLRSSVRARLQALFLKSTQRKKSAWVLCLLLLE